MRDSTFQNFGRMPPTIVCKNVLEITDTLIHYDFPPPPNSNVDYSKRINFSNMKNVIFNIDMGEGGGSSSFIDEK